MASQTPAKQNGSNASKKKRSWFWKGKKDNEQKNKKSTDGKNSEDAFYEQRTQTFVVNYNKEAASFGASSSVGHDADGQNVNTDVTEAETLLQNILDDIYTYVNRQRSELNYRIAVEEANAMAVTLVEFLQYSFPLFFEYPEERPNGMMEWLNRSQIENTKRNIISQTIPSPHCECSLLCRNIRLVTRHFDKEIRAKLENLYAERFIMELTVPVAVCALVEDLLFYNAEERQQRLLKADQEKEERRWWRRILRFFRTNRIQGNCWLLNRIRRMLRRR
uniref:Uncharacterized protein n=1 Tax=Magallana gigas TaxID=29159 RepID=A0A8W8JE17_MAGGI|nr:uncharacterized protein LOC105320072 [Crassostrea gigas]